MIVVFINNDRGAPESMKDLLEKSDRGVYYSRDVVFYPNLQEFIKELESGEVYPEGDEEGFIFVEDGKFYRIVRVETFKVSPL